MLNILLHPCVSVLCCAYSPVGTAVQHVLVCLLCCCTQHHAVMAVNGAMHNQDGCGKFVHTADALTVFGWHCRLVLCSN